LKLSETLAFIAYYHITTGTSIYHEGEKEKSEKEHKGVFLGQWFILDIIISAYEGKDQTSIHGHDGAGCTLTAVTHAVEILEFDIKADSR
jgi:hypothetical protein